MKIDLNNDWEFAFEFSDDFLAGKDCDTESVRLPHTTRTTPFNYFDESVYQTVCGYRRRIAVDEKWKDMRVFLCVGAAGHTAEVFVNGKKTGEHRGGYTSFKCDVTDALEFGSEALIVIRVDSRESQDVPPFGHVIDYMTYGGLYREVWLEVRRNERIEDLFAVPDAETGRIECLAELTGGDAVRLTVRERESGAEVARTELHAAERLCVTVPGHKRWDVDSPFLYELTAELLVSGEAADAVTVNIGFRTAVFRADGFYLNGRKLRIVGLNRHQSWPYVGYAMPRSQQRLDAEILKRELGVNAVRTSHYPQSQHFIDRCDELGLMVFTEIPGWQHIGGEEWKKLALQNVEEMVKQYRNHPSVILWGVRINESRDDDALYAETNKIAHRLDPSRQTGGVRCFKKSNLLEDVYTYNDFVHDGSNAGCDPKKKVTSDASRPYLITEYCGHMYPTKNFDCEEHRLEHALRHARVLDAVAAEDGISGSFGWCMADYNTHRDFGSGDRVCYHGVTDMFRNKKLAADVYSVRQDREPVLSVSSTMDIGEHPAGYRGRSFIFTNADEVRMFKNGVPIRSYTHADSEFRNIPHPPVEITDYVGDQVEKGEDFKPRQARFTADIINHSARFGSSRLPFGIKAKAAWLMLRYRMTFEDAYQLYGKYVGNWGDSATVYRFDAVKDGKVVKSVVREAVTKIRLCVDADHTELREGATYDVASVRIRMTDQNGNTLPYWQDTVSFETSGPVGLIGPDTASLRGGMGGTYVKTAGETGKASLTVSAQNCEPVTVEFNITADN